MKKTKLTRSLLAACSIVALSVVLSGCLHSSDDSTTATPTTPTEPTPPPGPTAESLKADAADAITAANAAGMAAEQAEKDALKYADMLTAQKVDGESATAVANAQKILDAETAANDAVMDADDALNDAMEAKTAAEALAADDAGRAGAIAAAEEAIKQATAQKKAAQAILDKNPLQTGGTTPTTEVDSLKDAVALIKGNNPLADDYPMMPAAQGKVVATSVKAALGGTIGDGTGAAPTHATLMNDGSDIGGMTWAMLAGEDNVMMKRLGTVGSDTITAGNGELSVASIAGMAASAVNPAGDDLTVGEHTDTTVTDAADINYKGIPGVVICLGGDDGCSVSADGTLSAGWYFTPESPMELYIANPDMAGMYMVATMYARYGYWLTFDATTGAATSIDTYAAVGHSTTNTANLNLLRPSTATADVTASYSGSAAGISARGDASGHFTANVKLTATFGEAIADSSLSGYISGFKGEAVNSSWRVTLNESALTDAAALGTAATDGIAYGGAAVGAWTAQGYGPTPVDHDGDSNTAAQNQRPEGFFGRFNANFTDGMAAGGYAARADDE